MAQTYHTDTNQLALIIKELQHKVDTIPSFLLLVQAATESAWGTSRFAKNANTLFGEWCFTPRCGIVPLKRNHGQKHQLRNLTALFNQFTLTH